MMNLFKSTPRPLQLCWGDAAARAHAMTQDDFVPMECMDVRGCRKNALLSRELLPVGSPLDAVQPVFDEAGRYAAPLHEFAWLWVEVPEDKRHALYDGPHMYPTETVQVLMRENFLMADADTLPFGWIPSHRFPSSKLADAWSQLHHICGDDGTDKTEKEKKAAKTMILATIGLWNRREHMSWTVRRTTHDDDMPGPVLFTTFRSDGSTLKLCATELHDNRTLLPIALLSLFDEQIHMHRARQIVAQVPAIVPLGAYVDGLFYTGTKEAQSALKALANKERYRHIDATVFDFKPSLWNRVPQCEQPSERRPGEKPRLRRGWDAAVLERDVEQDASTLFLDELATKEKKTFDEHIASFATPLPPLSNASYLIVSTALESEGMLCLGAAGCGKSVLLKQIKAVLEGRGDKVRVCAYTHAACRMVGGATIAHLMHKNISLADTWILVDECGLLSVSTLGEMSRWQFLGAKFIFFGDYQGQFEPFGDRWNMSLNDGDNDLMHQLCGGYCVTLQTYRRGADPELFAWYHGMYGQEDARKLANLSRARYPSRCDPLDDPLVLCLSHKKRMSVNARQNERLKPPNALFLEWNGEDLCGTTMQPQSMHVWVGMELIGCPRGSGMQATVQGVIYVVTAITANALELQMRPEYRKGEDDDQTSVTLANACKLLRLCHAQCYYTVQGRTVRDRHILLLDTGHPFFSVRALIVGLSRATHGQYLHVGDDHAEALFCDDRVIRRRRG